MVSLHLVSLKWNECVGFLGPYIPFMVARPYFVKIKHALIEVARLGSKKITKVFYSCKFSHCF